MAELVANCPRCGSTRITFDLRQQTWVAQQYNWQNWYEAFCVCRKCHRSTVFILSDKGIDESKLVANAEGLSGVRGAVNDLVRVESFVSLKDRDPIPPPEHIPPAISAVFSEGATCLAANCFNAAGTMFRLCVDLATRALLPPPDQEPNSKIRRNLGLRLPWLIESGLIPEALRDLSTCVKDDGNDGAHEGTLSKDDAADLLDFTTALLERLYTEPERLRIAKDRRDARRGNGPGGGV